MIVFEFKDYCEVNEGLELINEGLFKNIGNWMRKNLAGKPYYDKADELIGPDTIESMIDPKTGDLIPEYKSYIEKDDIDGLFKKLEAIKPGQMWTQGIKFMKDGFMKVDKANTMKVASEHIGTNTNAEDQLTENSIQSEDAAAVSKEALNQRAADFDAIYKQAKVKVIDNIKKQVDQFLSTDKKINADETKWAWVRPLFNTRLAATELALTMLEYDLKKIRWNIEGLEPLKQQMTNEYKNALKYSKELDASLKNVQTEETSTAGSLKEFVTSKYNVGDNVEWFYADKTDPKQKGNPAGSAEILAFEENTIKMKLVGNGKEFNVAYGIFRDWIMPADEGSGITEPTPGEGEPAGLGKLENIQAGEQVKYYKKDDTNFERPVVVYIATDEEQKKNENGEMIVVKKKVGDKNVYSVFRNRTARI